MSKITHDKYLIVFAEIIKIGPMANAQNKHPLNIPGPFYCTDPDDNGGEGCIACNVCYSGAPEFYAEDDNGNAYIKKQPSTPDEIALCVEQMDACPVNSIGKNG
jgi:ferredoxin